MSSLQIWDTALFSWVNQFAGRWFWVDSFAVFFAQYSGYVLPGVLILILVVKRKEINWKFTIGGVIASLALSRGFITEIIRFFYDRSRPFEVLDIVPLVEHSAGSSFPSGHAAFYFALSWFLFFWNKKIGIVFLAATLFMTAARVFTGVHYPGDIAGGFAIGLFSAGGMYMLFKKILR